MAVPDVSVIVVSWNTRDHLAACLATIGPASGALAVEVCVVDNGSGDGSADLVAGQHPDARLLRNPDNRGFAAAVNQGLAATTGRYALLLNPDARLPADGLRALVDWADAHADVGIVGAALRDPDGTPQDSVAAEPTLATELLNRDLLRWLAPRRFPDDRIGGEPRDVPTVIGACLLARRAAIERVGPMDEGFFVFLEETDWCVRMRGGGWRVVHHPGVVVEHAQGAAARRTPVAKWIEYHRSLYRFFRKHRGLGAYLVLRVLRPPKLAVNLLLNVVALTLTIGLARRARRKIRVNAGLCWWHLRGCPASMGLRAVAAPRA